MTISRKRPGLKNVLMLAALRVHLHAAEQFIMKRCLHVLAALPAVFVSAHAQRYDVTPFVGGVWGGTVKLEQQGLPNVNAEVQGGFSFGVAGGFRFDSDDLDGDVCRHCDSIEFRWLRQNTHVRLKQDAFLVPTPTVAPAFNPAIALDYFLADFAHEWNIDEAKILKPFVMASIGAALLSAPQSSAARFVFGVGTGLEILPKPRWGFRFQVEYLPIVMHAELQRLVCVGGCVVVLNGGIMNRFEVSFGPAFRF
jgi:hypothetical protein